jgi:hypothetical protein
MYGLPTTGLEAMFLYRATAHPTFLSPCRLVFLCNLHPHPRPPHSALHAQKVPSPYSTCPVSARSTGPREDPCQSLGPAKCPSLAIAPLARSGRQVLVRMMLCLLELLGDVSNFICPPRLSSDKPNSAHLGARPHSSTYLPAYPPRAISLDCRPPLLTLASFVFPLATCILSRHLLHLGLTRDEQLRMKSGCKQAPGTPFFLRRP